jgi:hypothetical protein
MRTTNFVRHMYDDASGPSVAHGYDKFTGPNQISLSVDALYMNRTRNRRMYSTCEGIAGEPRVFGQFGAPRISTKVIGLISVFNFC